MGRGSALDSETIGLRLSAEAPAWRRDGEAIARRVAFEGFARPMLAANAIAYLAEAADHHPDLTIRYGSLEIRLSTHSAGGVTDLDFALAARIDAVLRGADPAEVAN